MKSPAVRSPSEVLKRGYTNQEIDDIYELARIFLESGQLRKAEAILIGLSEIAPDFAPAWLGLSYIQMQNRDYEAAIEAARTALQADSGFVESMLYLVACLLIAGDLNSAGTFLGEVGERIDNGEIQNPEIVRFYRIQLARYELML